MIRKLLTPPTFDDQEKTHVASQLWVVVTVMTALSTLYLVLWLALVPDISYRIVFALPLYPLFGWLFHLIRKGKTKLAGSVMVGGVWLVLFVAATFSGGVLAPGYSGLFITVLAAGIFLSKGWALNIAALSVVAGAILVYLDRLGLIPPASEYTDATSMWLAQAVYFFIAASLLRMATQRISSALQRAEHEIEQRRKTEDQLREAERRYRELVESVPAVMYSAEPGVSGRWFYVNPQVESISGYTAEEWMSDPDLWYSRVHPDDRDQFIAGESLAIAEGRLYQMEYRFIKRDGSTIWIRDESLNVTSDDSGSKVVVQGILQDITARKQAEEKLRSSEILLTTIIENIPFDFWVCDDKDRYILQNPISRKIAGDLIYKTVDDLDVPRETREEYRKIHRRVLSGEAMQGELEVEKMARNSIPCSSARPFGTTRPCAALSG